MNSLQALGICVGISSISSFALLLAISQPLSDFIAKICPDRESIGFWLRFTIVMLFLAPLFFTVSFGLPPASLLNALEIGELIQRAVTSTLIGAFFAMMGMGIWVSSLARRAASNSSQPSYKTPPY
jgi:hypothetical protein